MMEFIASINWANPTWDMFIILFFLVAAFLYGLSLGRDRIIVILVSIYMALAIINTAPYVSDFNPNAALAALKISESPILQVGTFLGVFIVLFFLLSRSALAKTLASADERGRWWEVLVYSFLHVGLLLSITFLYLPEDITKHLNPKTLEFFTTDPARLFWLLAPIFVMVLIRRKET